MCHRTDAVLWRPIGDPRPDGGVPGAGLRSARRLGRCRIQRHRRQLRPRPHQRFGHGWHHHRLRHRSAALLPHPGGNAGSDGGFLGPDCGTGGASRVGEVHRHRRRPRSHLRAARRRHDVLLGPKHRRSGRRSLRRVCRGGRRRPPQLRAAGRRHRCVLGRQQLPPGQRPTGRVRRVVRRRRAHLRTASR